MEVARAIDFETPENAFLLGLVVALGPNTLERAPGDPFVRRAQEEFHGRFGAEYVVDWPSDNESKIVLRSAAPNSVEIAPERARAFAQGALCGLLVPGVGADGIPFLEAASGRALHLGSLLSLLGIPPAEGGIFEGAAALDALGRILEGAPRSVPSLSAFLDRMRSHVTHLNAPLTRTELVSGASAHGASTHVTEAPADSVSSESPGDVPARGDSIRVQLVHPEARLPSKEHISDSGYDLTLLYEKKRFGKTILFGTGVIVEPPFGWYFDVVPRSSIIKQGYILANSVGVIDRSYRGEIFVPLIKID